MKLTTVGIDLGATSGRVVLGKFNGSKFEIEEVHRFPNRIVQILGSSYWNLEALFDEIVAGLSKIGARGEKVDSIGVDTWGVDVVCVGRDGRLLGQPRAYRDSYTDGVPEEFFKLMPRREVYGRTGIQIMNFNTLFQLYAQSREENSALSAADKLLFIPDAVSYMLTGQKVCEYTILSTSQLMNPLTHTIDSELLVLAGVKASLFPEVVMPGHKTGTLTDDLARRTGLGKVPVIAVAGHDTGSAVAAVPATSDNFAYLSSGTWSLMGIETLRPIISDESYALNFTNEGGIDGTTRVLKNITGMWLLEECRREWSAAGRNYTYPEITAMMTAACPFAMLVDPDDASFAAPKSMTEAIKHYCASHNEPVPENDAQIVRCIFDSLALKYRKVSEMLRRLSPNPIEVLHIIGGGSKNALLNQMTANSLQMPVIAGPSEATVIGNLMVQAKAAGAVGSTAEMRRLIYESVDIDTFMPTDAEEWNNAYEKFSNIIK